MAFQIPVTGGRALDGAAMFLCILAYPDNEVRRRQAFEACIAHRVRSYRESRKHLGIDEAFAAHTRPLLNRWPSRDMWGALAMLNKHLLNRRRAAELLGYYGVSEFMKPGRRVAGLYPERLVAERSLRLKPDGSLSATDVLRMKPETLDPSRVRAATNSDLIRVGAKRWCMVPRNVVKSILAPAAPVAHMALALREAILRQKSATAALDVLDLLVCPQWVLPAVEDSQIVARTWAANSSAYPAWRKIDSTGFIELMPLIG